ncbi:hypothetical protein KCU67_g34, partial [Aureobasidium melanogenum]
LIWPKVIANLRRARDIVRRLGRHFLADSIDPSLLALVRVTVPDRQQFCGSCRLTAGDMTEDGQVLLLVRSAKNFTAFYFKEFARLRMSADTSRAVVACRTREG